MRARYRVDHALDCESLVEIDDQRRLAGDPVQKLVRLDDQPVPISPTRIVSMNASPGPNRLPTA